MEDQNSFLSIMTKTSKPVMFNGLNGLRFFSALAIIIYHSLNPFLDKFPSGPKTFIHNFPLGVDMFFIISGFLIVYLLMEEKEESGQISMAKFYLRRILRIFPLYFLIVGIAFAIYGKSEEHIEFSNYFFFWGNFWMIKQGNWTVDLLNPLWSLCIEEHFYLVIPVLLAVIPISKSKYLFWFIILLSIAFRIYATETIQYNWMTIYCHTLSRCDVLAIGGLIAYYHKTSGIKVKFGSIFFFGALLQLVLVLILVDAMDYSQLLYAALKKYMFIVPMIIIFIFVLFNTEGSEAFVNKIFDNRILNYLGKISYGLYMFHSLVGHYLDHFRSVSDSPVLLTITTFLLTVLVSSISYEFFEKQILKLKSRFEVVRTNNSV